MSLVPDTIDAVLNKRTIRAALLATFEFATGTDRLWAGFGTKVMGDGYAYKGMGQFGSVDGLSSRNDLAAEVMTFKLSGVEPQFVTLAKQSSDDVKNRPCTVFIQFFDEAWRPLDQPIALRSAVMDQLQYEAVGVDQRNITLTAEGLFAARGQAPFAYYTDRDQNARFAGDRGLEGVASLQYRVVTWPDY